ncbi:hypothetical protein PV08_05049 [Exophiala spinifera]|uniref:Uncharacterized protein n=1 Tax=Exophiala spinifera TaxID=91928 RepID=A0A0D2C2I9_9EURO|nr:uncharacterized protein PV08_05049 [Exophiala spinifera]KIW17854.1 hypothetical protein PV08_05049 [Exophiala spinifera]
MSSTDVPVVGLYRPLLERHIQRLSSSREEADSDAPILESDCVDLLDELRSIRTQQEASASVQLHNAALETVFRELLIDVVARIDISEPAFSQIWTMLDITTILSDNELCDPGLGFWLVEELLDSQTIDGCRKVFDYLESRRERMTAKHFKQKSLVILRCCNELLRRLSRAEDTVFCGRVFIFLFQSFPLGDKSSVNLRGEFHVENVTTFDPAPKKSDDAIKPMEIDTQTPPQQGTASGAQTPSSSLHEADKPTARNTPVPTKAKVEPKEKEQPPPDLDTLYPKFWTLQTLFSSPTRLFDPANMATFKDGISSTLAVFRSVAHSSAASTASSDVKRGLKRKRTSAEADSTTTTSTFNPKYLTNRDLFDLEIHDTAFRRHVLVQALILLDFLLSLAPSAKVKFEGLTNKSVLYSYTLGEEDAKWAQATRASIAAYLQQGNGNEGKFYYRMVDTVLSRDKNWVRWKAENCPPISKDSIAPQAHLEAKDTLTKIANTAKAALPNPPGAGDLSFLSKVEPLEALKHPSQRHKVPTMEEYYKEIERDDLDLDFAVTDEEKNELEERKAGKVWRALRASKNRFVMCEKVQYGGNLKALIEEDKLEMEGEEEKPTDGEAEVKQEPIDDKNDIKEESRGVDEGVDIGGEQDKDLVVTQAEEGPDDGGGGQEHDAADHSQEQKDELEDEAVEAGRSSLAETAHPEAKGPGEDTEMQDVPTATKDAGENEGQDLGTERDSGEI